MSAVDFERFVHDLATRSGEAILPFFRTHLAARNKASGGGFDPVTEADRAAEMVLRRMINQTFPTHGIIGEEFGSEREDAELVWVLDPIDGTRAFMSGLPVWGTLIGLTRNGSPAYGMMHQPFTRERFFGDGEGARYRGPEGERELNARPCESLSEATVMTTSPRIFKPKEAKAYDRVEKACRLARYGCDCYAYCMLAAGQVDLVIEAGLQPYDIVALAPIVEGAGGVISTWDGGPPGRAGASSPPATPGSTAPPSSSSTPEGAGAAAGSCRSSPGMKASKAAQKSARTLSVSFKISWRAPLIGNDSPVFSRAANCATVWGQTIGSSSAISTRVGVRTSSA